MIGRSRKPPSAPRLTFADLLTHSRAGAQREETDRGSQDYVRANSWSSAETRRRAQAYGRQGSEAVGGSGEIDRTDHAWRSRVAAALDVQERARARPRAESEGAQDQPSHGGGTAP